MPKKLSPEEKQEEKSELDYPKRILRALAALKTAEEEYLSPEGLRKYSPKFLKILENLKEKDNEGLHLIYSQFRTLEGIGILKLVLEANGYAEFKIRKITGQGNDPNYWEIVEKEEDAGKPRFALYTGTESTEEKEIILNIYNGAWEYVPVSITTTLREQKLDTNVRGEVIKALMITASGAEGINLKNTRYVHVVEPYWHMVRLEQVIGRARRICSHEELPEKMRTIKVFLYLAVLTEKQRNDEKHIELRLRDVSKLTIANSTKDSKDNTLLEKYVNTLGQKPEVLTTDQMLFETALVKDRVNNQLLNAVKETAIDCSLYSKSNRDENLVCYGFGKVESNNFASYPNIDQDLAEKDVVDVVAKVGKYQKIEYQGKTYAFNKATGEIFDYLNYEKARDSGETLIRLGRLMKEGRKMHFEFDKI